MDGEFLNKLVTSVTHCKFEASEASTDEVVLVKILVLLYNVVSHPVLGRRLSDESICFVMETIFSMCFQVHSTDILRRTAEQYLIQMISHIFKGLAALMDIKTESEGEGVELVKHEIHNVQAEKSAAAAAAAANTDDLEEVDKQLGPPLDPSETALKRSMSSNSTSTDEKTKSHVSLPEANVSEEKASAGGMVKSITLTGSVVDTYTNGNSGDAKELHHQVDTKPYGVASLREIMRFLASLIDQQRENQKHNTDSMRLLGMKVISVAVHDAGSSLGRFPSILGILRNEIFRSLFLIFQDTDNLSLLRNALRCALNLFVNLLPALKCHLEFHLNLLLERLISLNIPRLRTLEMQESILEHIYQVSQEY